jgi:hypothetical protein
VGGPFHGNQERVAIKICGGAFRLAARVFVALRLHIGDGKNLLKAI